MEFIWIVALENGCTREQIKIREATGRWQNFYQENVWMWNLIDPWSFILWKNALLNYYLLKYASLTNWVK